MKLIREEIEQVEIIVEQRNGKKNLYIEGVFLQGNIANRNKRMYDAGLLEREVKRYNENFVNKKILKNHKKIDKIINKIIKPIVARIFFI